MTPLPPPPSQPPYGQQPFAVPPLAGPAGPSAPVSPRDSRRPSAARQAAAVGGSRRGGRPWSVCGGAGVVVGRALDDDGDVAGTSVPARRRDRDHRRVGDPARERRVAVRRRLDVGSADAHGTLDVYDVVQAVSAEHRHDQLDDHRGTETGEAVGTGIVVSADGQILTNNHVVEGATDVRVRFPGDTEPTEATVVATDAANDLALLRGRRRPRPPAGHVRRPRPTSASATR